MGSSKQSIYLETIGTISEETCHEFITELLDYLCMVKIHATAKIKEIHHTCKKLFKDYTKPFFDKWSFLKNLQMSRETARNYSFIITYSGIKNILPYDLIAFEALNPKNTILNQLQYSNNIKSFFFTLTKFVNTLNFPLIKNDLKIIKYFMNPTARNKILSIPTNRQIAKSLQLSENTVSRRINYLYCNSILYHIYRINMAKLGYYSSAIIHLKNLDVSPLPFEPYCLVDTLLDWGELMAKIKIFQIPSTQKNIFCEIKDYFEPLYEITLTKNYIGWNLSGLTSKTEVRWQELPPIFLSDEWIDHQFSGELGIEQNLISNEDACKITTTQAKMLDLIQNGMILSKNCLSNKLNVGQKYIKQFYNEFFSKNLITRFSILSNVGLLSKVWITLLGPRLNSDLVLFNNVIQHLKFFPFSYLFYNDNNLDSKGRIILSGLLWMPSSWYDDLYKVWFDLMKEGFMPKISICQGEVKWGIDLVQTYNFS
ncbi:MAG: hypothetical protein ACFFAE_19280 [Candidatus Hodarchaeota archaeon]